MSKSAKKLIKLNKNEFIDRRIEETEKFPELTICLETFDTVLLLLNSQEEQVLVTTLKHIMEFVHRNDENFRLLKEKNVLDLLLEKQLYRFNTNILVKRLALYLASFVMENVNSLLELEASKRSEIVSLCLTYYIKDNDDFCLEYLSVVLNKCLEDPQIAEMVLKDQSFVLKYFSTIATSANPDVVLHSLEIMYKLLLVRIGDEKLNFIALTTFPINRLMCELNCEFFEIRQAVLKVIQSILTESSVENPLNREEVAASLLEQLTKMFCESLLNEELLLLVEVLSAAMEYEFMISLFFESNLFNLYLTRINDGTMESKTICTALKVLSQCAKCVKFLPLFVSFHLTEKFLEFLLTTDDDNPAAHIIMGLNRLMKSSLAAKCIVESCDRGLLEKILELLSHKEINIKTREQSAYLLQNLLSFAFHKTATAILDLNLSGILAGICAEAPKERSTDLILAVLSIIETINDNSDYRKRICSNNTLISNIGALLMNSFGMAILVTQLFRCLCSLVSEESVHQLLIDTYLCSSIKRAVQSLSHQVKTAVTNFIIQTTRFPKLLKSYIESDVLDALIFYEVHACCVETWTPAIESILSKSPTLKFCIRNSLGFNDTTVGHDFMVSKKKFDDFRVFQCILKEEVSPLHPVIVVSFNRAETPKDLVVRISANCLKGIELGRQSEEKEWCYCRLPGDEFLPKLLAEVHNSILEFNNLAMNPKRIQSTIDFDNLSKRAKALAQIVARFLGNNLKNLDLNTTEECSHTTVKCHLKELCKELHCSFIPLGRIRSGCQFERAILFKALADQIGLPCTLQRSVNGRVLFNEVPLPLELEQDTHCPKNTMTFMPWRRLRPTHIVDLMYNVGELYPVDSRKALQYLRLQ